MEDQTAQQPPETLEGWYALHQIFSIDRERNTPAGTAESDVFSRSEGSTDGWSEAVELIGSTSDVMFIHFRQTIDEIGQVQRELARQPWMRRLVPTYSFLSVTEAGLYHLTAKLAEEAAASGVAPGDAKHAAVVKARVSSERENPYVRRRLYPERPAAMPYVSFYPMSKKRDVGQNWYSLPIAERSRLMHEHGLSGRRYSGRVQQVITGAIGFDAWEWGVTLFAADPLDFKKIVTDLRFDVASAEYAEFGPFYVGRVGTLAEVLGG
ncbi:MAG: chlorite dismutase family protein [Gemmatimonadaceae bacterium]